MSKKTCYPETKNSPDFPAMEKAVLERWRKDGTFKASIEQREGKPEYVFYDGPPFANGLPHYGHLLTSFVKDMFARYHTQKGEKVERRFGWDCHGLPAEMESEKELEVSGRAAIEKFGIDKFNEHCRTSVMKYTGIWQDYITRAARWVDFENDYKTMDKDYMESVLWAFKELYDKGLVYESHRVMPYSWAAETPLSNFETRMDDSYREREDKAITVAFRLNSPPASGGLPEADNYYLLAWTTTPWTLPSNLALAVSPEMEYACILSSPLAGESEKSCYILAFSELGSYAQMLGEKLPKEEIPIRDGKPIVDAVADQWIAKPKALIKGSDLIGLSYEPLFPYFKDTENAFRVLEGDFIEEGSGTGIVHLAPGFGEDDQRVCEAAGIPVICPVDEAGRFTDEIFDLTLPSGDSAETSPLEGGRSEGGESSVTLSLKGLNVIAATKKAEDEPYTQSQLEKYGLANLRITNWLKMQNRLVKQEDYKHSYPHCWRTDTPLIYKAMPSWYVEVTKFKQRMVELNQNINWIPEHIKDGQFGKWLEGARDWSISRNRFWGTPIPVWRTESGKVKVFGSIEEMEKFFLPGISEEKKQEWVKQGYLKYEDSMSESALSASKSEQPIAKVSKLSQGQSKRYKIEDLHKPFIDSLSKEVDGEVYKRVPDVFDCWFESGSMPFAQVHYPFENKEWFRENFPADFIVEYVGQTRGWFYTLMVLSTALFDKEPFKNCICHGVILDSGGKKLSKRLRNYPDPGEMFETYGADAMRWRMVKEPVMHGGNLLISKDGSDIRDVVRLSIKPVWNAYHFFTLYANSDGVRAEFKTDSDNLMDRYILAKCADAVSNIERAMDNYLTPEACSAVDNFFEVLNNWYIRRSRDRFWRTSEGGIDADKQAAYDTLYTVLITISTAAAPLLPLTMEEIWQGLAGGKESVHLQKFPDISGFPKEEELMADMDRVRDACNAALAVRNEHNIRIRQPLAKATLYGQGASRLREFAELIADEINVKSVEFSDDLEGVASFRLQINFPVAGKRLGGKMKDVAAAARNGDWQDLGAGKVKAGEEILAGEEFSILLQSEASGAQGLTTNDAVIVLDLEISDSLKKEGLARDVIRFIQQARKEADLHVSDHITLAVEATDNIKAAIEANIDYISEQTLADSLTLGGVNGAKHISEGEFEGRKLKIGFSKAA